MKHIPFKTIKELVSKIKLYKKLYNLTDHEVEIHVTGYINGEEISHQYIWRHLDVWATKFPWENNPTAILGMKGTFEISHE